ncbi:MAG TPA: metal-dependent hydrolase [Aquabacterium sp.]|uniref:metal-dependent hydrolase n=1 Tax=Aquabacterium sp. TaxID=1872578 RepID=UPI002E316633|nr:metal-dependent hydrolase [Aquabacterium sp.]HEX5374242.1 metal-dependent hydrolase [Aquabacterium sp.]
MSQQHTAQHPIVPRERLNFHLDDRDIPKYWFGGDPFKTRLFDALSLIFPPGEKFFMTTVRDFRSKISDKKLIDDIMGFNRQEAQHTLVHNQYNDRLRAQGMDVDRLIKELDHLLFSVYRNKFSRDYTLAITCALEHFTAIGAATLFDARDVMKEADHRVRAMYSWHAIEEVEHKGVAYDVMCDYAKVSYFKRIGAMLHMCYTFPATIHYFTDELLKMDGFNWWQRRKIMIKGIAWVLRPGKGLLAPLIKPFFPYFKPGYHPWQDAEQRGYEQWLNAFNRHRDPVEASELMREALALR